MRAVFKQIQQDIKNSITGHFVTLTHNVDFKDFKVSSCIYKL